MRSLILFACACASASAQCAITNTSVPNGVVGMSYSQPMTIVGCAPTEWIMSGGPSKGLPPGLQLDRLSGVLSGTPLVPGIFNFTVTANASGSTTSKSFAVTIALNCEISMVSMPNAAIPNAYSKMIRTTGCAPPVTWSTSSESNCSGLTLDPATGTIAGSPAAVGTCSLTATVVDANGSTSSMPLTVQIDPICAHTVTMLPSGEIVVYKNGIRQKVGIDYKLSTATLPTITWLTPVSSSDAFSLTLLRSFTLITKINGLPWTGVGYRYWDENWTCPLSTGNSSAERIWEMGLGYGDGSLFTGVYPLMCCKNMTDHDIELVRASCTSDAPNDVVDIMIRDAAGSPLRSIFASPLTCSPSSPEMSALPGVKLVPGQQVWFMFRVSQNPSGVNTAGQIFADLVVR